ILRAMEKDPARRFESAFAFRDALRQAVSAKQQWQGGRTQASRAVGVYVEIQVADTANEMVEDAVVEDLTNALDIAERMLRDRGFLRALATGSSVLGARVLTGRADEDRTEWKRSVIMASELWGALSTRPSPDPNVHIKVCAHVDDALVRR